MSFSSTTLAHITSAIACNSNSASLPNLNSRPSQIPPRNLRFGSFGFSCALAKQSTRQVVSALKQLDSFRCSDKYGWKYVPQTLMLALSELESAFKVLPADHEFQEALYGLLREFVCKEGPLYFAEGLTGYYKRPNGEGPEIYFKREDGHRPYLHKINNAVGQALLAKKLGKKRIIAEVGAGEDGVAAADVCKRYGLQCIIYVAAQDMERQTINLNKMKTRGAEVRRVDSELDATSEAVRDWITNLETTHYIIGSGAGPHPYPMMVREFFSVIGKETRKLAKEKWGGKPDVLVSFVGGVSNAMGLFNEFVEDKEIRLIGVEPAGFLLDSVGALTKGEVGVLDEDMRYLLQDDGQTIDILPIIERLNLSGVGLEHKSLEDLGRAEYYKVSDKEAIEAYYRVPTFEGLTPSLEASHALAYLEKLCPTLANGTKVVVNLNARGENEPRLL